METPEQTEQDLSAKISFLNARHTLEHLARSVEDGIERGEGGWETNAEFCRLHPFAAMLKIATLLQSPNGVIDSEIDEFTLECAEHCDASLDELFEQGEQEPFVAMLGKLREFANRQSNNL